MFIARSAGRFGGTHVLTPNVALLSSPEVPACETALSPGFEPGSCCAQTDLVTTTPQRWYAEYELSLVVSMNSRVLNYNRISDRSGNVPLHGNTSLFF